MPFLLPNFVSLVETIWHCIYNIQSLAYSKQDTRLGWKSCLKTVDPGQNLLVSGFWKIILEILRQRELNRKFWGLDRGQALRSWILLRIRNSGGQQTVQCKVFSWALCASNKSLTFGGHWYPGYGQGVSWNIQGRKASWDHEYDFFPKATHEPLAQSSCSIV